jgi:acyl carrier protein
MAIRDEVVELLTKKAVQLYHVDPATLSRDTRFIDDLHAKSVHVVQFTAVLEDEFELEVPFMEFAKMHTFGDVADWIAEELGE